MKTEQSFGKAITVLKVLRSKTDLKELSAQSVEPCLFPWCSLWLSFHLSLCIYLSWLLYISYYQYGTKESKGSGMCVGTSLTLKS